MSIRLTPAEKKIAAKLVAIKKKSTSHSPSPAMLQSVGVEIAHDFCYLSNPYATEVFLKHFRKDFSDDKKLRGLVEYYPSQNRTLAEKLERVAGVPAKNIFVGNGATEIIQAVLHHFTKKKMLVPVPTFSPYLEFAPKGVKVLQHQLKKENEFKLDTSAFLSQIQKEKPDTVVIINPSNPDGGYLEASSLKKILQKLSSVETVIVDESFIHFSGKKIESVASLIGKYPNLVVIKSLSKDFGIAGLRLGYAVMSPARVSALLERGYLWNVSGFGEYFLDLLGQKIFLKEYERARLHAVADRDLLFTELSKLQGVKVYPSKANFFLIELISGTRAEDLTVALLSRYGIYIRTCGDKVGLSGEFVRIASRTAKENKALIRALQELLSK